MDAESMSVARSNGGQPAGPANPQGMSERQLKRLLDAMVADGILEIERDMEGVERYRYLRESREASAKKGYHNDESAPRLQERI